MAWNGKTKMETVTLNANVFPISYQRFYLCVWNGRISVDLDKID